MFLKELFHLYNFAFHFNNYSIKILKKANEDFEKRLLRNFSFIVIIEKKKLIFEKVLSLLIVQMHVQKLFMIKLNTLLNPLYFDFETIISGVILSDSQIQF